MSLTKSQWPSENGLRVGSLNVCDISNNGKLENISVLLDNNGNHIHIMGITESRCFTEEHIKRCNINNYDIEASLSVSYGKDKINKVGVLVYIHSGVVYKRCTDLEHPEIECIWLKINYHNTSLLVGQIYRNGTYDSEWFPCFENMMDKVSSLNIQIILLGDININTLDINKPVYKQWSLIHPSYNLTQLIDIPTRVAKDSSTIIDHIYILTIPVTFPKCAYLHMGSVTIIQFFALFNRHQNVLRKTNINTYFIGALNILQMKLFCLTL